MQNLLIGTGTVLVIAGLLCPYLKQLPFGRLPGDIAFKSDDTSFFFPIVTCIVMSIVLSLVLNFFGNWTMLMRLRFPFLFILPLSLRTSFAESIYDSAKSEGLYYTNFKDVPGLLNGGYYMYQRDGIGGIVV